MMREYTKIFTFTTPCRFPDNEFVELGPMDKDRKVVFLKKLRQKAYNSQNLLS